MKALAHSKLAAFTLIEMLIVIGLIAAIMSIVVVNFGGTSEQAKFQLVETFVESAVSCTSRILQKRSWAVSQHFTRLANLAATTPTLATSAT
jgi:prepilin-type N-terminal cleavage/methylation domain-containing protein